MRSSRAPRSTGSTRPTRSRDPDAQRFDRLTYLEVLARDLKVMDASAISLARESSIPIIVFSVHAPGAFARVLRGEGPHTIITEEAAA